MDTRIVLFPTDFSAPSETALRHASAAVRQAGAHLLIVHVDEPLLSPIGEGYYIPDAYNRPLQPLLESVRPPDPDVPYSHVLLQGDPAEEILRLAKEREAELIVMGTHGRRGLTRLLMGSVAEAVLRRAPCPVMIVKQPSEVPAAAD